LRRLSCYLSAPSSTILIRRNTIRRARTAINWTKVQPRPGRSRQRRTFDDRIRLGLLRRLTLVPFLNLPPSGTGKVPKARSGVSSGTVSQIRSGIREETPLYRNSESGLCVPRDRKFRLRRHATH